MSAPLKCKICKATGFPDLMALSAHRWKDHRDIAAAQFKKAALKSAKVRKERSAKHRREIKREEKATRAATTGGNPPIPVAAVIPQKLGNQPGTPHEPPDWMEELTDDPPPPPEQEQEQGGTAEDDNPPPPPAGDDDAWNTGGDGEDGDQTPKDQSTSRPKTNGKAPTTGAAPPKSTSTTRAEHIGEATLVQIVPKTFTMSAACIWQAREAAIQELHWAPDISPEDFVESWFHWTFKAIGITLGGYAVDRGGNGNGNGHKRTYTAEEVRQMLEQVLIGKGG